MREPSTGFSGSGCASAKYSSGMVRSGGIRTVMAVTTKVTMSVTMKYVPHTFIKSSCLATMTMKAAETVEKPVAIIAASRPVYPPFW